MYWDYLDFPKKIWGLGALPTMGHSTPQNPQNSLSQGPGPHIGGGAPDPKIFLGSLDSPNTYIICKLGG